jgi:hypothetical protein
MFGVEDSPATDPVGFFLIPADPESNNLRVYVVAAATRAVYPLEPLVRSKAGSTAPRAERAASAALAGPLLPTRLLSWLTR